MVREAGPRPLTRLPAPSTRGRPPATRSSNGFPASSSRASSCSATRIRPILLERISAAPSGSWFLPLRRKSTRDAGPSSGLRHAGGEADPPAASTRSSVRSPGHPSRAPTPLPSCGKLGRSTPAVSRRGWGGVVVADGPRERSRNRAPAVATASGPRAPLEEATSVRSDVGGGVSRGRGSKAEGEEAASRRPRAAVAGAVLEPGRLRTVRTRPHPKQRERAAASLGFPAQAPWIGRRLALGAESEGIGASGGRDSCVPAHRRHCGREAGGGGQKFCRSGADARVRYTGCDRRDDRGARGFARGERWRLRRTTHDGGWNGRRGWLAGAMPARGRRSGRAVRASGFPTCRRHCGKEGGGRGSEVLSLGVKRPAALHGLRSPRRSWARDSARGERWRLRQTTHDVGWNGSRGSLAGAIPARGLRSRPKVPADAIPRSAAAIHLLTGGG
jgi:hypothetical protein